MTMIKRIMTVTIGMMYHNAHCSSYNGNSRNLPCATILWIFFRTNIDTILMMGEKEGNDKIDSNDVEISIRMIKRIRKNIIITTMLNQE